MDYLRSTFTALLLHFIIQIVKGFELVDTKNVSTKTCIIGASYSGLATAKHLKKYNKDFTIFEASKYLGGVWHFDPRVGIDENGIPIFSKMYKNLRMGSPYVLTEFNDFPFPEGTSTYPSSECVFKYLSSFASKFGLIQRIQFSTLVTSVKRFEDQWQLTYWKGDTKEMVTEACDYVVLATGFFNDPVWPEIQGSDTFQGTMSHSSTYRGDTEVYRNRRVLIVGAGVSGLDIASQISKVASKLFHSHHRTINLPVHEETYVKKPDIKLITQNGVIFTDGSFEEIDDVIYCTGYTTWHRFLDDSSGLVRTGKLILPLYRKIVNIKHSTMLVVGVVTGVIHKVFDAQANYAASLIAGRFQLPSEDEMMKSWVDEVNKIQNIENIFRLNENYNMDYYCGILSQEAGIPPLPPVFNSLQGFNLILRSNGFIHSRDYDWHAIDDYNFDCVYVGPKEVKCPIE